MSHSCSGPTGGQEIGLSALRSIAVDRTIWSFREPALVQLVTVAVRQLMIAQDTGSAITGPARCDIFFGSGDDAGAPGGNIRHKGEVYVLLPRDKAPDS